MFRADLSPAAVCGVTRLRLPAPNSWDCCSTFFYAHCHSPNRLRLASIAVDTNAGAERAIAVSVSFDHAAG